MTRRILVPLDRSETAERIVGWVTGFARAMGSGVHLVSVVDSDDLDLPETAAGPVRPVGNAPNDAPVLDTVAVGSAGMGIVAPAMGHGARPDASPAFGTQVVDRAIVQAEMYLHKMAREFEGRGVTATVSVEVGLPAEEIVRAARRSGAGMIAMATRRDSALARGILGSVTDRVLHSSPVPVLTVHPREESAFATVSGGPDTVIVPLDGSELSECAVPAALEIARACNAEAVFLRSLHIPAYAVYAPGMDYTPFFDGMPELRRQAAEYLQGFVEQATRQGVRAHATVVYGVPATRINEALEAAGSGMVVMATRGTGGLQRWVMGSVTDKVIRSSGQPVLVIPPIEY